MLGNWKTLTRLLWKDGGGMGAYESGSVNVRGCLEVIPRMENICNVRSIRSNLENSTLVTEATKALQILTLIVCIRRSTPRFAGFVARSEF
jgi:hypothetical protein